MLPLYICSVQELFSWLIEVDGSVEDGDRGRIVFTLEYEMTRSRREVYAPVSNKAVAFVTFQHDNTLAVLPVVKVSICCLYIIGYRCLSPLAWNSLLLPFQLIDL